MYQDLDKITLRCHPELVEGCAIAYPTISTGSVAQRTQHLFSTRNSIYFELRKYQEIRNSQDI